MIYGVWLMVVKPRPAPRSAQRAASTLNPRPSTLDLLRSLLSAPLHASQAFPLARLRGAQHDLLALGAPVPVPRRPSPRPRHGGDHDQGPVIRRRCRVGVVVVVLR
jgi:hypothetical protein